MSVATNPYLVGNFAPVEDEVTAMDLAVTGRIPEHLDGRYLRNGPNPASADPATYHWFTGDGMVHGIRLRDGRAEWYRNRRVVADADDPMGFGPNTNVIGVGGRTLAIVEAGPSPVELDDELATLGPCDMSGTLEFGYSAHPKLDPATGLLHSANYTWTRPGCIDYTVVDPSLRVVRHEEVPVPGSPMVHDMSITERYAVFYDQPVVFDLDGAMAGSSFPYVWSDDYGCRVGVLPLGGAGVEDLRWFEVEPCYVFHPLNAHDAVGDDGAPLVVLDVVRHDRVFDASRLGPDESVPTLWRWTLDLRTGTAREEQLGDHPVEFPRVDERRVGRPHRHGWAVSVSPGREGDRLGFDGASIARIDSVTGEVERHEMGPGRAAGEAVFVPSSPDAAEDDGVLMTLVYDAGEDRSDLVLLDAGDPAAEPVAVVHLPRRVPFGFHGNWVPA